MKVSTVPKTIERLIRDGAKLFPVASRDGTCPIIASVSDDVVDVTVELWGWFGYVLDNDEPAGNGTTHLYFRPRPA